MNFSPLNRIKYTDKFQKKLGGKYNDEIFNTLNNKYNVIMQVNNEMEDIKQKAIEWWKFLFAPNWKLSKLDEKSWLLVRTKSFKNWFWDRENNPASSSKILDENWEPQIMYHGSNKKHIKEFKIDTQKLDGTKDGVYFVSNKKKAKEYSLKWTVYENFLNIKNPLIIDFKWNYRCNFSFQDAQKLLDKTWEELKLIQKPYYKTNAIEDIINTFKDIIWKFKHNDTKWNYAIDDIVKIARQLWYDWIIAKNVKDIGKFPSLSRKIRNTLHNQVIVLDPNQIKNTNNIWTFSKNNNNTRE